MFRLVENITSVLLLEDTEELQRRLLILLRGVLVGVVLFLLYSVWVNTPRCLFVVIRVLYVKKGGMNKVCAPLRLPNRHSCRV